MSTNQHPAITRRRFVGAACACAAAAAAGVRLARASEDNPLLDDGAFFADGLLYTVLDSGTEVSVGSGTQLDPSAFGDGLQDPSRASVSVPPVVEHNGVVYTVTQIAPFAFQNSSLREAVLPEGLVKIGKSAFQFCRELERVCVPASVELMGAYCFFGTNGLVEVTFAEDSALTEVSDGAFAVLKTSGSVENPDPRAALVSIELPASLKILGAYAFYGQSQLASVVFKGDSINSISPYCFGCCTALERIDIPTITSTIERVGRYAFEGDVSLKEVTFRGGVSGTQTTQSGNEFKGCTGVQTVIYYDKKWNASNLGSNPVGSVFGSAFSMGAAGFADAPDVREYYTVRQYASLDDAAARQNSTGYAVVPAGTPIHEISAGTCEMLESQGFEPGAWAYEDGSSVTGLGDSVYAYPCDRADLAYASVVVHAPVGDEGEPVIAANELDAGLPFSAWDAAGVELVADDDFTARYEDNWGAAVELGSGSDPGYYTLFLDGRGRYGGEAYAYFTVSEAPDAWTRLAALGWEDAMQLATQAAFANASVAETACLWAVVAPGGAAHVPEALCAAALAGALDAPLLLTGPDALSDAVAYEINRVGAPNVVIVGDAGAVSQEAESALGSLYVVEKVYRIAGTDAADTAARVLTLGPSLGAVWGPACLVVPVEEAGSAVAVASFAYARQAPVLFTAGGALPEAALAGVAAQEALLVGGAAQASGQLEGAGVAAQAIDGPFASWELSQGIQLDGCVVTDLGSPAVAVASAALAGRSGAAMLGAGEASELLGGAEDFSHGWVLGSEQLVSGECFSQLEQAVRR